MKKHYRILRLLSLGLLITLGLFALQSISSHAQEKPNGEGAEAKKPAAKPASFENASISTLLDWASRELAIGFLYSPSKVEALRKKDASGEALTISYRPSGAASKAEKRVLLFEALREIGFVPMPVRGMKAEVYRVVSINEAAQLSKVSESIEELDGYYFGTLGFRAKRLSVDTLKAIVAQQASPDASAIYIEETSSVLVSDFVDALRNIYSALASADRSPIRDSDIISEAYPLERHDAATLTRLLLQSRVSGESFQAVHKRGTSVILLSGTRQEVLKASRRLDLLESAPLTKEVALSLHSIDTRVISASDLQKALATHFAFEVQNGAMRFAAVPQRDQVLVSASAEDFKRVQAIYPEFDRTPKNAVETRNTKRVEERRAFDEEAKRIGKEAKKTPKERAPNEKAPSEDPKTPEDKR